MNIYAIPKNDIIIIGDNVVFCTSNIIALQASLQDQPITNRINESDLSHKISFEGEIKVGKSLEHLIAEGIAKEIDFQRQFEQKERGVIPPKFFKKSFR